MIKVVWYVNDIWITLIILLDFFNILFAFNYKSGFIKTSINRMLVILILFLCFEICYFWLILFIISWNINADTFLYLKFWLVLNIFLRFIFLFFFGVMKRWVNIINHIIIIFIIINKMSCFCYFGLFLLSTTAIKMIFGSIL